MNPLKVYDVKAIARRLDISERRVRQLREQGIIEEFRKMPGLFDIERATIDYIRYLRRNNSGTGDSIDYNAERAKLMRAKREDIEHDLGIKKRELHTTEEIKSVIADVLINFKSRLAAIPAKASPALSKKSSKAEIHKILKRYIDEALSELSEFDKLTQEENP